MSTEAQIPDLDILDQLERHVLTGAPYDEGHTEFVDDPIALANTLVTQRGVPLTESGVRDRWIGEVMKAIQIDTGGYLTRPYPVEGALRQEVDPRRFPTRTKDL